MKLPDALVYYGGGIAAGALLRTSLGWTHTEVGAVSALAIALGVVTGAIDR